MSLSAPAHIVAVAFAALASCFMVACSGGDGTSNPPLASDGQRIVSNNAGKDCSASHEGCGCGEEGATMQCGEPVSQDQERVTCAMGTRTCKGGAWSACTLEANQTSQRLATVGCEEQIPTSDPRAAKQDPCNEEGRTRVCTTQSTSQVAGGNCWHGKQTCSGGVWGACQ